MEHSRKVKEKKGGPKGTPIAIRNIKLKASCQISVQSGGSKRDQLKWR
jgi:hypothetical protein